MNYFKVFLDIIEEIKEDPSVVSILLIGKTAKAPDKEFNHLNDVDLLIIYDVNRPFERQIERIHDVPFDISYISIFDLITQIEAKSLIWVNMMMGAKVYFSKNELVFGIIDRVKDIYLNGTNKLKDEDVKFIRFTLSQKLVDIENRKKDVILSGFLIQRLFLQVIEDYYSLNSIWPPHPKNTIENLGIVDPALCDKAKDFINESSANIRFEIIAEMIQYVLEPHGGKLMTWEKGHYNIAK